MSSVGVPVVDVTPLRGASADGRADPRALASVVADIGAARVERLSIPFFVNPDPTTEVACMPSCVTPERPCRYEPITASAFLPGRVERTIALDDVRR